VLPAFGDLALTADLAQEQGWLADLRLRRRSACPVDVGAVVDVEDLHGPGVLVDAVDPHEGPLYRASHESIRARRTG
jgi:hypothetical protein